jgi:hypothetical protein
MKHTILCLLSLLSIAACKQPSQQPQTSASRSDSSSTIATINDSMPHAPEHLQEGTIYVDSAMAARLNWIDSLASVALKSSANPRIRHELKDSTITWMWDKLVFSDTATYISLHIGHEEGDKKGFKRFVTAGWLYVDTLSRNVYEYNVSDGSLIKL